MIDKPEGMGSMQVTTRVRRHFGKAKAGHAGTLDPFATGLLPIALGKTTRLIPYLMKSLKTYRFSLRWGSETTTGDFTGETTQTASFRPTRLQVLAVLPSFQGHIQQTPPPYAAIKIAGERAYVRARRNESFEMPVRTVWIEQLRLVGIETADTISVEVTCGSGTYVRSLGQDIARALGTRGHLVKLRRTKVGPFHEKSAISLDSIQEIRHDWPHAFYPPQIVLDDIPAFEVEEAQARRLCQGQRLWIESLPDHGVLKCLCQGRFVALARSEGPQVVPLNVFEEPDVFGDPV